MADNQPVTPVRIRKPMPIGGRRTSVPADQIAENQTPQCLNVRFRFGEVRGAPGRGVLAGPATGEPVLWIGQFPQLDGSVWAMMLTTTHLFRWGDSGPGTPRQWHEVPAGDLNPSGSSRWSVAIGEGKMFFGRIDDPVFYWDGIATDPFFSIGNTSGVQGINGGITGPFGANIVPRAKFLEYFNDRLVLLYTIEGATSFGNRMRWAESGNFLHWNETLGLGAGFLDLVEGGQEPITGAKSFGSSGRMYVSTRTTVKDVVATGTNAPTHVEQLRLRAFGSTAPYTLVSNGQQVFFMGYDRTVYAWDGVNLAPIGQPIFEELQALTDSLHVTDYFGAASTFRQEYWLVLPPTNDAFVYDYSRGTWSRDSVPNFTALGEVEDTTTAPRWIDMTTFWDTETHTWAQLAGTQMTAFFAGRSDGSTSLVDDTVSYDYYAIGSIMDRFVETPDMYLAEGPWKMATSWRLLLIYQFVNNQEFEVGVSGDRGNTWTTQMVVPNSTGYSYVDFIKTSNVVRFRFRENNATGQFRWRSYVMEFDASGDFIGTS